MILQALAEHYYRLLAEPDSGVSPLGYSPAKVSHALIIDEQGALVDILPLADIKSKKTVPKVLLVPEQPTRTSGIAANILCDSAAYVLGLERSKQGDINVSANKFHDFKNKNELFLREVQSGEAAAVRSFLAKWNPPSAMADSKLMTKLAEVIGAYHIVFKLDGALGYIHETDAIKAAWEARTQEQEAEVVGQCLITGEHAALARIHPLVKGVVGAQTSGASVVSFNADAFTSYSKSQSFNAPVSKQAAFAYATALNYLISSDLNRVRLADTTMVFWADKKGGKKAEAVIAWSLDPVMSDTEDTGEESVNRRIDYSTARQAKTILERIKAGLPAGDSNIAADARCYLLGLAPNAARLSVRFWRVSSFGEVLTKIARHYQDMEIVGIERLGELVPPWRVLKALAVQEEAKNIPPLLAGQFLQAILSGQAYPQTLYNLALSRCRTGGEHGGVNSIQGTIRAAVIKAFLMRQYRLRDQNEKEAMLTMGLNEDNNNTGYQLGRLFSLLEKVQKDALGNQINATIRDRYFGAASAAPASVFPLLLRLSRHHIAKAEYGNILDRKIQSVVNRLSAFPNYLSLEDQGQFILGYYHQNQANYTKNENKQDAGKGDNNE